MIRLALFIGLPLLELFLLASIEERIGLAATLGLVVVTGVLGAAMVRRQGRLVWQSIKLRLSAGEIPDAELAHGAMLLVAGVLLVTPGVVTDAVGLVLLFPVARELIRLRFFRALKVVIW